MSKARELADRADNINAPKNYIINGGFDVWQRATSQTTNGYGSDDRWANISGGSTKMSDRQTFALGQTDVAGNPKYYSRTVVNSVAGASNYVAKVQRIEDVTKLAGKTVTITFWAQSNAARNIEVEFEQYFGSGGSPSSTLNVASQTVSLTTSWAKYSLTFTLPSVAGKTLGTSGNHYTAVNLWFDAGSNYNARLNNLGQGSGVVEITRVSVCEGDVTALDDPFEDRSYGEELALCERYYLAGGMRHRVDPFPAGSLGSDAYFPTTMRTIPTVTTTVGLGTLSSTAANTNRIFFEFTSGASGNISTSYTADAEL